MSRDDSLYAVDDSLDGGRIPLSWFVKWGGGGKDPIDAAFVASGEPKYMLLVVKNRDQILKRAAAVLRLHTDPTYPYLIDPAYLIYGVQQYLKQTYFQGSEQGLWREAKNRVCSAIIEVTDPSVDLLSVKEVLELYRP